MDLSMAFMFIGFALAAYAVIANDSVQTLGTFMASNSHIKWYWLWLAAFSVFVFTVLYSWYLNGGDISHGRLNKIPFHTIEWYHTLGPLALFILTRFGIPVSTTFMVLSLFASSLILEKMLIKSFIGYGLAAVTAFTLWFVLSRFLDEHLPVKDEHKKMWRVGQWLTTGFLWFTWLSHDMANIAVFLPRNLEFTWVLGVIALCGILLAYIFNLNYYLICN